MRDTMMPPSSCAIAIIILSHFAASVCFGAKILFVPGTVNSHTMFFTRLAVDLAELGHVTTVLAPSSVRVPDFAADVGGRVPNFAYVAYPVAGSTPFLNSPEVSGRLIAMAMTSSPLQRMRMIGELNVDVVMHGEENCVRLLDNEHIMHQARHS